MPAITVEVPHSLGLAGAKARLESFVSTIEQKYAGQVGQVEGSWHENTLRYSFSSFNIKIGGSIVVQEDKVVLHVDIPFTAMIFKGKIVGGIQHALEKALQ